MHEAPSDCTTGGLTGESAPDEPIRLGACNGRVLPEEVERQVSDLLGADEAGMADASYDVAVQAHRLAKLLTGVGRVEESAALYRRSFLIKQQVLEPGHPELATTLHNLALVLNGMGRTEEARMLWDQARGLLHTAGLSQAGQPGGDQSTTP